jgi:hypothetical protein
MKSVVIVRVLVEVQDLGLHALWTGKAISISKEPNIAILTVRRSSILLMMETIREKVKPITLLLK